MKRYTYISIILICFQSLLGQEIVIAENGLNIRTAPKVQSQKIGKLPFGTKIRVIEKTSKTFSIKEKDKIVKGEWVKIEFSNYPMFISEYDTGYVFNGYLKNETKLILELQNEISNLNKFKDLKVANKLNPFVITGDFFGDGIFDYAIKVIDSLGIIRILVIDKGGEYTQIIKTKRFDSEITVKEHQWQIIDEFGELPIFKRVNPKQVLWSNYDTDFRSLEDVPNDERVILNYDSIYVHASESCGGGFIFWNNGKFNWLQQE